MKFGLIPKQREDPDRETSSQSPSKLPEDSFAILNEHAGDLANLYYDNDRDNALYIQAIKEWKDKYLEDNKKRCDASFLKNFFIKNSVVNAYCYNYEAIENAEPEDIKSYIKNSFIEPIPTGGKRKSLRSHKKSKKRKQTKHMKKGKNGKKSKTKKVKRSRH